MANPPYSYWPIVNRPELVWPGGKKMAFYVDLNIEHFIPGVPGIGYIPPYSMPIDPINQSWRDYGNRVGIWRIAETLDELGLPVSAAINSSVCEHYPQIIEAGVAGNWSWMAHGITNSSRWVGIEPDEEAKLLDQIVADISNATGHAPRGWIGPGLTETPDTLRLLGERGFTYTLDWGGDDQPFPLLVPGNRMVAIPFSAEINDIIAFMVWHWSPEQFANAIRDQFKRLHGEAQRRPGVVMPLALHPFLAGSPFRHEHIEQVLREIRAHDDVWFPTVAEIADFYLEHHYDTAVAAISKSQR